MNKETTLFILLDAFRWDYLDPIDTPNLWAYAQAHIHISQIKPSAGFCERSEIFTGTKPIVNGNFSAITYSPTTAPLRHYQWLFHIFDRLHAIIGDRYTRRIIWELLYRRNINIPLYQIPISSLATVALTEDLFAHQNGKSFIVESIFDLMLQEGKRFYYDSFTALGFYNGNDNDRIARLEEHITDDSDLYMLYIGDTDAIVHKNGVTSQERHLVCSTIDKVCLRLIEQFEEHFERVNVVILGDHGMTDVTTRINLEHAIHQLAQQLKITQGIDYQVFLDSTMARFWFKDPGNQKAFNKLFLQPEFANYGTILTAELGNKLEIPLPSTKYGEFVWWANPGVIIYPDYFHRTTPMNAMHGYIPTDPTTWGTAIIKSHKTSISKTVPVGELIDICPTLCNLIGIPYPQFSQGRSFVL